MPLYRCQNPACSTDPHGRLIFDFEADQPRCPKCNADSRRPEHKFVVVKREVIHFHIEDPRGPDAGFGKRRRIACDAKGSIAGKHATGDVAAVTCPACRKTPEWETIAKERELLVPPDLDFPIEGAEVEVDGKMEPGYKATPPDRPPPGTDCGCGGAK